VPRLRYYPDQFPAYFGGAFAQPGEIDFTWGELCKSAVTVGRQSWVDVLRFGPFSVFELTWRVAMLWANLREDPSGLLIPSSAFVNLDPSERGAISYFLGNCFTKLVAEKLFGVPWLMHVDVYRRSLGIVLTSNSRPDFVGFDPQRQWAVVEAKGHMLRMRRDTMQNAKRQTRSVRRINGQFPALRSAVGIWFSKTNGTNAKVWDPRGYDPEAEDFDIDTDHFLRLYYEPLIDRTGLLQIRPRRRAPGGKPRRSLALEPFDAEIILDDDIVAGYGREAPLGQLVIAPKVGSEDSILAMLATLEETERAEARRDITDHLHTLVEKRRMSDIGETPDDGVTVELGRAWRPENMRRDPAERAR
jgi:hypothetical protein